MKRKKKQKKWRIKSKKTISSSNINTMPQSQKITKEQKQQIPTAIPENINPEPKRKMPGRPNQVGLVAATKKRQQDAGHPTACLTKHQKATDKSREKNKDNRTKKNRKNTHRIQK
ncbi:hypothetical protein [Bacteroides graminisolvens]|uniref:hypothetical protein n=1 Tax=Bacteroides graminisolvens TaxID=477666 RepID=UPI000482564B|nr:hypothetical protein [Bacteroides graminisolvens]